jgi:hypothetical protein
MFFMSMMSLMGMAMNPAESAAVGSHGNEDSHSEAKNNDSGNSNEQTDQAGAESAADYSNVGDSTSFQGFDGWGGGFDSF